MSSPVDVTARMQELVSHWQSVGDRRAVFLHCYLIMTTNVQQALQSGEFEDGRWVAALLDRFAAYYNAVLLRRA